MNIDSYLKQDHKKVIQTIDQLLISKNDAERMKLFDKIKNDLLLHAKTEQDTFYKILENVKETEEQIKEAKKEHKEIEKQLKELTELEFDTKEWIEKFGELKHSLIHHIEEKEEKIFQESKKNLSANQANEFNKTSKYNKKANA